MTGFLSWEIVRFRDHIKRSIKEIKKSNGKRLQIRKEKIQKEARNKLQRYCNRTKMRIVETKKWEKKEYIQKGNEALRQKIFRIRLNMRNLKGNYRNKFGDDLIRPLRHAEEDMTEHHPELNKIIYVTQGILDKICDLYECNEKAL